MAEGRARVRRVGREEEEVGEGEEKEGEHSAPGKESGCDGQTEQYSRGYTKQQTKKDNHRNQSQTHVETDKEQTKKTHGRQRHKQLRKCKCKRYLVSAPQLFQNSILSC